MAEPAPPTQAPDLKTLEQAGLGLASGVAELPKTMLLDFPAFAMRASDWLTNNAGITHITPQEQANEPVLKGIEAASKYYDDTIKSVMQTSDETANSTAYDVGSTVGSFVAFPGGAEKAIMEAPSLLGKGWRTFSHALNPATIPGKAAAGVAWSAGPELLVPAEAQAGQTAPPPQPGTQLPTPKTLSAKWQPFTEGQAVAPAPSPLGPKWQPFDHPAIGEHAQKAEDDSNWVWAGLGTAAAIGVAVLSKGRDAKSAMELSRAGKSIFGKVADANSPAVNEATRYYQGAIDGGASARETMMKANPQLGQDFADRQTLASPTVLAEKTQMALRDGLIASTNTRLNPLVDQANKLEGLRVTKDPMAPQKAAKYAYALDALDGANRPPGARLLVRKYDGWEKDVPAAVNLPEPVQRRMIKQHLQGVVDAIEQPRLPNGAPNPNYSPEIMQIQNALKQNYASMSKHLYKSGMIDRPMYLDLSTRDYLPLQAQLDQGSWLDRFKRAAWYPEKELDPRDEWSSLMERKNTDGERILSPIDTQEQYIRLAIRHAEHNNLRKMYIEGMLAQPAGSDLRKIVMPVSNTTSVKNLISYKVGGVTKNYQIKDQAIYNALKFNPGGNVLPGIVNMSRKALQAGTTGLFAPLFAPAGLAYDVWGIMGLGNKVGPLGLAKVPYWALRGMAKGLGARMAGGMSQFLKASLYADGFIPKLLGPQVTQTLIDRSAQAWRQSLLFKAQSVGAMGSARAEADAQIGQRLTFMSKLAPRYATRNPALRSLSGLARMYTGLFQSVQESARLGYFEHLAGQQPRLADLMKAGAETRRVTGDFAQAGASKYSHAMSEIFPYYNISMQSMARIASQFKNKPMQTLTQVSLGLAMPSIAGVVYASQMGPKYRDYYWNRLSSADRSANIYLPIPGLPPERGIFIPVMPEWRAFHAMLINSMDGIFGFSHGIIDHPENKGFDNGLDAMFNYRMYQDVKSGVMSGLSPFSMPPAVNATFNLFGQRNASDIASGQPFKLSPLKPDDLSALDPDGSTRGVWMPQKVEQIIGSLAGTAGQAFVRAAVSAQQAWHGNRAVVPAAAQAAALEMTRNIPLSTTMWKLDRKIGANTPMDQYATDTFAQMKTLAQSAGVDISNAGIGTRGVFGGQLENEDQFVQGNPDATSTNFSRFKDPEVAQIVANAGIYMRFWSKQWGNAINANHKQIEDVRSSDKLSPAQQRTKLNRLYAHLQDLHKAALSDIQDNFIKGERQRTGRAIDIGNLNENTMLTDFPPLTAP